MSKQKESRRQTLCSFCGKNQSQVRKLVAGPGVYICDQCIDLCQRVIAEDAGVKPDSQPARPPWEVHWWPMATPAVKMAGRHIALAVTGGIAAFKAIECLRLLTAAEAEVRVLMTPEATHFVAPLTFEALSYHPVACEWLEPGGGGETHINLSEWADVLAIVPATANTLAKLALGLADDVVSATALATPAPLVLAPAMNDLMFGHPQTQEHLKTLRERGAVVVWPGVGRLASGKVGEGRLAAPERILAVISAVLARRRNMEGWRVVVSAGGTRELLDPVRYVGNLSSGKMGRALAEVASARGAGVTLVTTMPGQSEGITEVAVGTAAEMLEALRSACAGADVLVMAAAVADYRAAVPAPSKLKRTDVRLAIELEPNVDILAELGRPEGLFRVGFKSETEDLERRALEKLARDGLDLIVANTVGGSDSGMGSDFNAVTILGPKGLVSNVPRLPKWEVAERIWDVIHAARSRHD